MKPLRSLALVAATLVATSATFAFAADAGSLAGKKPNIVFLITDDQGYGDISANGSPVLKTPNLDRLRAEGVRFEDFHVSPTCSPTRASLMTGRHEFKSGVTHTILERERMSTAATTLPQILKTAGYATGIFGKWHLGDEADHRPDARGFDETFIHGGGGIGQTYPGSCGDAPGNTYFDPAILHNGKFVKTEGYCTDVFFAQAQRWIEARAKAGQGGAKAPFFCYIATNAPHAPHQVRPEDEARYADQVKDPEVAKFYGMIANIDDNVGKLLAKLTELGIERDTLVVFMNDNGGTAGTKIFNAGMRAQKGSAYRGGTRAATFWRWPGTLTPAACDRLAAHIDVFPTLAEIAGATLSADVQEKLDGRSLVSLLERPSAEWPERILFTHGGRWPKGADANVWKFANCSVRSGKWNLVSGTKGPGKAQLKPQASQPGEKPLPAEWELYDLAADPGETKNLAAEHPDVMRKLVAAYDKWWAEVVPATLENERAAGPKMNPFHELYYAQFGAPQAQSDAGKTRAIAVAQATAEKKPAANPNKAAKPQADAKSAPARRTRKPSPSLQPIEDVPGLPRVLLIGDSISMGYTLDVRKLLHGKANVHRVPANAGPTITGLQRIKEWLAPGKWDVIHFNWGLHDLKHMPEGGRQVEPADYEKNLRELVKGLKATGAKLIWCSTTPVPEGELNPPRKNADVVAYNKIAEKIMNEERIAIDDLYAFALPQLKEIQIPVNVHFHESGSAALAEQVAREIEKQLPKK